MSRLQKYINEEKSLDEIISIIFKDCRPMLKEIQKAKRVLWRGNAISVDDIVKVTHHKERRPADTPTDVHNHVNELFKKDFGWPARNGVFATGNYKEAKNYGYGYIFFPVGNYKFVWSPKITDFYKEIEDSSYINYDPYDYWNDDDEEEEEYQEVSANYEKERDTFYKNLVNQYVDRNMVKAIQSENEIMFQCKQYYLINKRLERSIMNAIAGRGI